MKRILLVILLLVVGGTARAGKAVPISIVKFTDKSGVSNCRYDWEYWHDYLGDGFKEMLANELMKSEKVALFERETIGDIYEGEHNLVNSQEDKSLAKGRFKKAKLTIVGAVTEFEYCAQRADGGINVGRVAAFFGQNSIPDISLGGGTAKARVAIDLRVIDVETGRVVRTVRTEGEAKDSRFNIDSPFGGYKTRESSPMGKAVRDAIEKASAAILTGI